MGARKAFKAAEHALLVKWPALLFYDATRSGGQFHLSVGSPGIKMGTSETFQCTDRTVDVPLLR